MKTNEILKTLKVKTNFPRRHGIFTTIDGNAKPQPTKGTHWVVKNKEIFFIPMGLCIY